MNKYFNMKDTIYDLVKKFPKAMDFLSEKGFNNLTSPGMFEAIAKNIDLESAIELKNIDKESFEDELLEFLSSEYPNMEKVDENYKAISIEGVLACPIRVPILEKMEEWKAKKENSLLDVKQNLQSANLGIKDLKEKLATKDETRIPDVIMSVGFDVLFDRELIKDYMDRDVFKKDAIDMNETFSNEEIDLKDPKNIYTINGVVPAIFLVDLKELNGRPIPKTWDDILDEKFANSVSIPMVDLDLFNALILNVYKEYGEDGIKRLARSYFKSLHPSQMVTQEGRQGENPAISIIPYFFTQMALSESLLPVWPEDGAMISPIFMLRKNKTSDDTDEVIDFFRSKEVGEVFSVNGKFPSTNPGVDNKLSSEQKFKWMGWDFIHKNDIGLLLKRLEELFNSEISKER